MPKTDILNIANQFQIPTQIIDIKEFGNGNINSTFLIETETDNYVLQKINSTVFAQPKLVMKNMSMVVEHVNNKIQALTSAKISANTQNLSKYWQIVNIIQTHENQAYWLDDENNVWRVISYIKNSKVFDTINDDKIAREVGIALGFFHNMLSDLPSQKLADTLPGFHITPSYLEKYDSVIKNTQKSATKFKAHGNFADEISFCTEFIANRRSMVNVLEDAKDSGDLQMRIIHGDPKVNNIMIDKDTNKAISIIDLDTVKPGLIHYDIGDCMRSGCNPLGEEAGENWQSVYFDMNKCHEILTGYLSEANQFLSKNDYEYIYDSIRLITFELGLRFFTDFLQGSCYFKADYDEHNLHRALVQFKLVESIEAQEKDILGIVAGLMTKP